MLATRPNFDLSGLRPLEPPPMTIRVAGIQATIVEWLAGHNPHVMTAPGDVVRFIGYGDEPMTIWAAWHNGLCCGLFRISRSS